MKSISYILLFFTLVVLIFSCERERFITDSDASISFSIDTLYFDTVFTSLGTATRSFTIHNPHKDFISISELSLAKAENSVFRINVDGVPGVFFHDIDIAPGDSLYVFVDATLDPNNSDEILLQQDSIVTITNGKVQDIDLVAWGQDVHLLRAYTVPNDTTWVNDKPYLIIDYLLVDSSAALTMDPGVRVYLHRDAIFAIQGNLVANGTLEEPISFQGDRLEEFYDDFPGQWGGIVFVGSSQDNLMNYVEIKGATFGINIISTFIESPKLSFHNSIIKHISSTGIIANGSSVDAHNSLIVNCGSGSIALFGGNHNFNHCTIANSWGWLPPRSNPSVVLTNYYIEEDDKGEKQMIIKDLEKAYFGNSIIWGNHSNELFIDDSMDIDQNPNGGLLNYHFENCVGKFDPVEDSLMLDNFPGLIQEDPLFISWDEYDFQLDTLSPAKDAGNIDIGLLYPLDLNGNSRTSDSGPDIGAYERIED